jgi:hypothetical protein
VRQAAEQTARAARYDPAGYDVEWSIDLYLYLLTRSRCALLIHSSGKGNMVIQSRSASFCTQRRVALEAYLITLSSLLSGTPIMRVLLEAIGLSPRPVDGSIEVVKRDRRSNFTHVSTEIQL